MAGIQGPGEGAIHANDWRQLPESVQAALRAQHPEVEAMPSPSRASAEQRQAARDHADQMAQLRREHQERMAQLAIEREQAKQATAAAQAAAKAQLEQERAAAQIAVAQGKAAAEATARTQLEREKAAAKTATQTQLEQERAAGRALVAREKAGAETAAAVALAQLPPKPACPQGYRAEWDADSQTWDCRPTSAELRKEATTAAKAEATAAKAAQKAAEAQKKVVEKATARQKKDRQDRQAARAKAFHGSEANVPRAFRTHVGIAEGKEIRWIDTGIDGGVAVVATAWTASRPRPTDLLWGGFWALLGAVMAVEGSGELRYAGFALVGSQSAYLTLRAVGGLPRPVL